MGILARGSVLAVCLVAATGASGQPKIGFGPPKGSEPDRVSAPVVYEDLLLLFASGDGVAAVVFTDKLENGIGYKYRYESKDGKKREAGAGKLFEKYKRLPGKKSAEFEVVDAGGEVWFKAGPFEVEWSRRTDASGWIYYRPEKVRVQVASADEFEKIDLKRFAK